MNGYSPIQHNYPRNPLPKACRISSFFDRWRGGRAHYAEDGVYDNNGQSGLPPLGRFAPTPPGTGDAPDWPRPAASCLSACCAASTEEPIKLTNIIADIIRMSPSSQILKRK
jgi:hypothetical protein